MQERHSGSDSYRFVDRLMNGSGGELLVVSPYIDDYYAEALQRASGRKRVRVITSSAAGRKGSLLGSLGRRGMMGYAKATVYFSALSAIVLFLHFYYIAAPIVAIAALMLVLMLRSHDSGRMQLKVTGRPFVHEKLYICNGTAVTGSANLTYNGMHRNVEHVDVTDDPEEVAALKRHFEGLWRGS